MIVVVHQKLCMHRLIAKKWWWWQLNSWLPKEKRKWTYGQGDFGGGSSSRLTEKIHVMEKEGHAQVVEELAMVEEIDGCVVEKNEGK